MALNRKEFLGSMQVKDKTQTITLRDGSEVLILTPTSGLIRKHRRSLRTKDGKPNYDLLGREAELLVATLLLDPDSQEPMFSTTEVANGLFDDLLSDRVEYLTDAVYAACGIGVYNAEQAAKNSSATPESESSGD